MIIEDFKEILDKFQDESKKQFKNNDFAIKMRNKFNQDFKEFTLSIIEDNTKYDSKLSPGMTNWTKRPWAGLRNSDATHTFQAGLYLIYLFDFDNRGFHLSLDQGNTFPSTTYRIEIAEFLIKKVKEGMMIPQGFTIDDRVNKDCILSKFYPIDDVSLEEMKNDLKSLKNLYENLISHYRDYISNDEEIIGKFSHSWINHVNLQYDVSANRIKKYLHENNLGNLKNEEYEKNVSRFCEEFEPENLVKLEGLNLLNKLFLHDGDRNNLCYQLEFSSDYKKAGGIKGGSSYKYSLFKNKDGNWIYGTSKNNSQILNENEAIEAAALLRNKLVEGANYIKSSRLDTIEDYNNLEEKLDEIFKDSLLKPTFSWVHKYFVLMFRDKFPRLHSNQMRIDFLNKFKIVPEKGYYAQDAQFYLLSKKAGIKFYSLFDENIVRLFFKGKDIWEPLDNHDEGIGDEDVRTVHYWLISPGYGAKWWDEFYNDSIMGIGMSKTGDLSRYNNKEEIKLKFQEIYNDESSHRNDVHGCWQFVHDIEIGDVVFAKKGKREIIGRGIVESDYEYDEKRQSFHNVRRVRWIDRGEWYCDFSELPTKTLTDITVYTEFTNNIRQLFSEDGKEEDEPEIKYPVYTSDDFMKDVYIDDDEYETLINLLKNKKNLIVQGAPGVGKTFMAKRLGYSLIGEKNTDQVKMVQFHQSYSYEDFVMGYRPYEEGFRIRKGSFYNFCKSAEEDSDNDYFFIIDEINRGNMSKIFGELFMLVEADKRGDKNKIQLLYADESFFIPKNLYIIGLMNTADRSLAMIDYALRRRFAFFDLKPGFDSEGFKLYQSGLDDYKFDNLVNAVKDLNREITSDETLGEGFRIGHSYLCNIKAENVCARLEYIVEYELIPLLKEYWFDETEKITYWSDKLRSALK